MFYILFFVTNHVICNMWHKYQKYFLQCHQWQKSLIDHLIEPGCSKSFSICTLLGDNSLWVCFCTYFEQDTHCLTCLFKVVYVTNSFGIQRQCLVPRKRQVCSQPWKIETYLLHEQREDVRVRTNDSDALSSQSFCNTSHFTCCCPLSLFIPPGRNWGSRNWCKNTDTLACYR